MNLVKEPWIPVVMQDGKPARVSLRDAFAKGEDIADLAANPCQRIALMRLLICVAQAALDGPKDEEDWLACKPRLVPPSCPTSTHGSTASTSSANTPFCRWMGWTLNQTLWLTSLMCLWQVETTQRCLTMDQPLADAYRQRPCSH